MPNLNDIMEMVDALETKAVITAPTRCVAVRNRHGGQTVMSFDAFAAKLRDEVDSKALEQN